MQAEQTFPIAGAVGPEDVTEMLRILRDITGGTRIDSTLAAAPSPCATHLNVWPLPRAHPATPARPRRSHAGNRDPGGRTATKPALSNYTPASEQLIGLNTNDLNKLQVVDYADKPAHQHSTRFAAKGFSSIPAVVPIGGGLSTFLLTLPSATVNFSDTLSLVQSGARSCCAPRTESGQLFRR